MFLVNLADVGNGARQFVQGNKALGPLDPTHTEL